MLKNNICTRFWKVKMQGRVRQKLNTNKIFTHIWETIINIFGVHSTFGLFTVHLHKFDDPGIRTVFLFYQSEYHISCLEI